MTTDKVEKIINNINIKKATGADVLKRIQSNTCKYVLKILDFNCKNILTCGPFFQELNNSIDIYLLQEHWLFDCQLNLLNEIHQQYTGVGKAVAPMTQLHRCACQEDMEEQLYSGEKILIQ